MQIWPTNQEYKQHFQPSNQRNHRCTYEHALPGFPAPAVVETLAEGDAAEEAEALGLDLKWDVEVLHDGVDAEGH
jgi:hypothetical protein